MHLTRVRLEGFAAFRKAKLDFSPGLNVIVGANGVGKTCLLQACYAAAAFDAGRHNNEGASSFAAKLVRLLLPYDTSQAHRLKRDGNAEGVIAVTLENGRVLRVRFPRSGEPRDDHDEVAAFNVADDKPVYIETADALGLWSARTFFGDAHADLMDLALRKPLPAPVPPAVAEPLSILGRQLPGPVAMRDGSAVALSGPGGEHSRLSLYNEGVRRLALAWLLIRNGAIGSGTALFWDEPATGLGPLALTDVAGALLALTRAGTQVILATHDYALQEEFRLQARPDDETRHHALYRGADGTAVSSGDWFVSPNPATEAYESLYDRAITRSLSLPWSTGDGSSC